MDSIKSKRGRKPKLNNDNLINESKKNKNIELNKVYNLTPTIINFTYNHLTDEPQILFIPLVLTDDEFNTLTITNTINKSFTDIKNTQITNIKPYNGFADVGYPVDNDIETIKPYNNFDDIGCPVNQCIKIIKPKFENNKCCWNCTLDILNYIYSMPYKYENNQFYSNGYFCNPNCIYTYILTMSNIPKKFEKIELLKLYTTSLLTNNYIFKYVPPKESLIKYGGIYTETEYRNLINDSNEYKLEIPPNIIIPHFIESNPICDISKYNREHILSTSINSNPKTYKLFRKKPIK
jgi:hypothetical protein